MNVAQIATSPLFECMLPSFVLDSEWKIVAMNRAFRVLAGDEWGCRIGTPVKVIIDSFDNRNDVTERAQRLFFDAVRVPQLDHEYCRFTSRNYGVVEFQKCGVCVASDDGAADFWIIQLNILQAERRERLFDDLLRAIGQRGST